MHNHCEHDLAHCAECDTAYCTKCSKEWGANFTYTPYEIITTVADTGVTFTDPVTVCSHTRERSITK